LTLFGPESLLLEKLPNEQSYFDYLTKNNQNPDIRAQSNRDNFKIEVDGTWLLGRKSRTYFPTEIDSSKGDFFIVFSSWVSKADTYNHLYMFQNSEASLEELSKTVNSDAAGFNNFQACQTWDGINL
jgi:hypothetical protein